MSRENIIEQAIYKLQNLEENEHVIMYVADEDSGQLGVYNIDMNDDIKLNILKSEAVRMLDEGGDTNQED